jgi:predicted esterase
VRVRDTAEVLRRLGGQVTMRLYPGLGHLVNEDEITTVQKLMESLISHPPLPHPSPVQQT